MFTLCSLAFHFEGYYILIRYTLSVQYTLASLYTSCKIYVYFVAVLFLVTHESFCHPPVLPTPKPIIASLEQTGPPDRPSEILKVQP